MNSTAWLLWDSLLFGFNVYGFKSSKLWDDLKRPRFQSKNHIEFTELQISSLRVKRMILTYKHIWFQSEQTPVSLFGTKQVWVLNGLTRALEKQITAARNIMEYSCSFLGHPQTVTGYFGPHHFPSQIFRLQAMVTNATVFYISVPDTGKPSIFFFLSLV